MLLAGCSGDWTDAATRIAYDIESAVDQLGRSDGDRLTVEHLTPSKGGECAGPYTVQLDQVGALIVWCKDGAGTTVTSHSTSYHNNHVVTPKTWIVEKGAGESLLIDLERQGTRVVIKDVR
jgi:hypothetical protein